MAGGLYVDVDVDQLWITSWLRNGELSSVSEFQHRIDIRQ